MGIYIPLILETGSAGGSSGGVLYCVYRTNGSHPDLSDTQCTSGFEGQGGLGADTNDSGRGQIGAAGSIF